MFDEYLELGFGRQPKMFLARTDSNLLKTNEARLVAVGTRLKKFEVSFVDTINKRLKKF